MNREEMFKLLTDRIKSCHKQFASARGDRFRKKLHVEGFRCRLDELILFYHLVKKISFVEACKELGVNYNDLNVEVDE